MHHRLDANDVWPARSPVGLSHGQVRLATSAPIMSARRAGPELSAEIDRKVLVASLIQARVHHRHRLRVQRFRARVGNDADDRRPDLCPRGSTRTARELEIRSLGLRWAPLLTAPEQGSGPGASAADPIAVHPEAERYRDAVTIATEQAIADAYDAQIASLPPVRNLEVPDLAARRTALARRDAIYDSAAPVTATLLATLIDLENRDAAAHGFTNAAAWKYLSLGLSDTLVDRTLAIVRAEAPAYREYESVLASHASKRVGVSPVLAAEQHIGVSAAAAVPFNEGRRLILESVAPLGPDYVRRFDALLDPANGRLDLGGGSHRVNIGTSIVAYDAPVAFYNGEYTGTLDNLGVIAHEGGHAIHRELMNLDSLPVYERSGSHFLFQGYAIFNQWLLFDHAARTADTPAGREQALEALLSSMGVEIFTSAEETTFERALYATASGQALLPRDKLDEVYRTSISPFEYWPVADVGRSRAWMTKSLLFEDPLYLVNYLYASFIAAALYDRAQVDPDFSRKYEALLRRGFDADPKTLLATIGIQLDDPSVIRGAIALFKAKTRELQSLYGVK
jgi:oligoendopeptidase F